MLNLTKVARALADDAAALNASMAKFLDELKPLEEARDRLVAEFTSPRLVDYAEMIMAAAGADDTLSENDPR